MIILKKVINFKEIENAIEKEGAIVVKKDNRNNVVVMSVEDYEKEVLEKRIEENLLKSEEDIKNGRVRDAEDVFKEWKNI